MTETKGAMGQEVSPHKGAVGNNTKGHPGGCLPGPHRQGDSLTFPTDLVNHGFQIVKLVSPQGHSGEDEFNLVFLGRHALSQKGRPHQPAKKEWAIPKPEGGAGELRAWLQYGTVENGLVKLARKHFRKKGVFSAICSVKH